MRNLIQKLLNWALGYDINASIRELKDSLEIIESTDPETIVEDTMNNYSNELEMLNSYDWDDFSQRLDNVQHLNEFSPDDLREELSQRLCMDGKQQAKDSNELKELQKLVWDRGERILALEIGINHLNEADENAAPFSISNQVLADKIKDLSYDLGLTNEAIEATDQWFQSFLKTTHEHFMQQAGGKD